MNDEEIAEVKRHAELLGKLRCPHCGGFQIEERFYNFTQYRCVCGYVESHKDKSERVIAKMWQEKLTSTLE